MKNISIFLVLFAALAGGCRSIKPSDYHSKTPMQQRLPNLNLLVHEKSFLSAYNEEYMMYEVDDNYWYGYQVTDKAVDDVFVLLRHELDENINTGVGVPYGHARFKLVNYHRIPGRGWLIPSICTMYIANLFGMPVAAIKADLELQMEIVDSNNKVLIRYVAPGKGTSIIALYHGYSGAEAVRRANLIALKEAMARIKDKMLADVPMLAEKLNTAGPLNAYSK